MSYLLDKSHFLMIFLILENGKIREKVENCPTLINILLYYCIPDEYWSKYPRLHGVVDSVGICEEI